MPKCPECGMPIDECSARSIAAQILGEDARDPEKHSVLTITQDLVDEIKQLKEDRSKLRTENEAARFVAALVLGEEYNVPENHSLLSIVLALINGIKTLEDALQDPNQGGHP